MFFSAVEAVKSVLVDFGGLVEGWQRTLLSQAAVNKDSFSRLEAEVAHIQDKISSKAEIEGHVSSIMEHVNADGKLTVRKLYGALNK